MSIKFTTSAHFYEIQEILGESYSSVVYLAQRLDKKFKIKQPVVIKLFKPENICGPILQMESLLRARHSAHLVKVLSFERFQSQPALILEHIPSANLKQLMKNTEFTKNEVAYICSQILTGLKELKTSGLAHGDLSPSNVLIDIKGQVYLTDYGLANYEKNTFHSTKPLTAPELYEGKKSCFQSDLFSLGVLEKILGGNFTQEELSSLESTHFICKGDFLLDPQPQNRKGKSFTFSSTAILLLSRKVHQFLFIKNCFNRKTITVPLSFSSIKHRFRIPYRQLSLLGIFFIFLFFTNPFISYGKHSSAEVLIRTEKWVHIQMNGFTGYSPMNILINKPGTYELKWKKKTRSGLKRLHLRRGQKVVLRDNDFL